MNALPQVLAGVLLVATGFGLYKKHFGGVITLLWGCWLGADMRGRGGIADMLCTRWDNDIVIRGLTWIGGALVAGGGTMTAGAHLLAGTAIAVPSLRGPLGARLANLYGRARAQITGLRESTWERVRRDGDRGEVTLADVARLGRWTLAAGLTVIAVTVLLDPTVIIGLYNTVCSAVSALASVFLHMAHLFVARN